MIEYAKLTSKGEREYNEDCLDIKGDNNKFYFVLCDGLGAHGLGNVASQGACDIYMENIESHSIEDTIEEIQKTLLREQERNGLFEKMKTTIVACVIENNHFKQIHLGDSRIYHFSKLRILSQTRDHSICQRLVDAHLIKKKDVRTHKDRNKLLEVLGANWLIEEPYITSEDKLKKFEAILMCSDGFWEWIEEKDMLKCLRASKTAEQWLKKMEEIVLLHGKGNHMDNYSAIAIFYRG